MTREEAIKLLKQYQGYEPMSPDGETLKHSFDLTDETVDALLTALRPVSRERIAELPRCEHCKDGKSFDGQIVIMGNKGVFPLNFCPWCGSPLTDEAVDMVVKRLEEIYK